MPTEPTSSQLHLRNTNQYPHTDPDRSATDCHTDSSTDRYAHPDTDAYIDSYCPIMPRHQRSILRSTRYRHRAGVGRDHQYLSRSDRADRIRAETCGSHLLCISGVHTVRWSAGDRSHQRIRREHGYGIVYRPLLQHEQHGGKHRVIQRCNSFCGYAGGFHGIWSGWADMGEHRCFKRDLDCRGLRSGCGRR